MKKIRSKKGMTLVELVVTVAILGMVASLGVGMVSSAIRNYSVASTTSQEQDTALSIESLISQTARIYGKVTSRPLPATNKSDVVEKDVTAFYMYFDGDTLVTIRSEMENKVQYTTVLKYDGVKEIVLTPKKQKADVEATDPNKNFVFVDYEINMMDGYSLKGSVVMNNAASDYVIPAATSSLIDEGSMIIIDKSKNEAIAIVS